MRKFRLLSLNVRIWTKCLNPLKWEEWWLPRTIKMRRLFRKGPKDLGPDETWVKPDIICLQERIYPLGKFLLGLCGYRAFGSHKSRLPIYVKRSSFKGYEFVVMEYCGTVNDNGHGHTILSIGKNGEELFKIQNTHHSFQKEDIEREINHGFYPDTIFCGDFNLTKDRYMKIYGQIPNTYDLVFFNKEPKGAPTYRSFENPDTSYSDIDQFGYTAGCEINPTGKCTIFSDRLSDHYPILVEFEV